MQSIIISLLVAFLGLCLFTTTGNAATLCARQDEVRCMVDPCMMAKCPAFPRARCQSNYCGGCNAEFYLNGVQVLSTDCQTDSTSLGKSGTSLDRLSTNGKTPKFGTGPSSSNDVISLFQFQEQPPLIPVPDLNNKPFPGSGPSVLIKDDTEHLNRGSAGGRNPNGGSRGGNWRGQAPRRFGPFPYGGPYSRPPFQGGRPMPRQNPPPQQRQRSSSRGRSSWFRNFFRGLSRRH